MLTAWLVCSTLLGLWGMFLELRKGSDLPTAVMGGVFSAVLWPVVLFLFVLMAVPMIIWGIKGDG